MRRALPLLLVVLVSCGGQTTTTPSALRVVETPEPTAAVAVTVATAAPTVKPNAQPTAAPVRPVAAPAPTPRPAPTGLVAFRALGSWIDVFDHKDDHASIIPLVDGMAARGTKTLYLETARYTSAADIQMPTAIGAALDRAKERGMRVVAWYPPAFDDLERDVRRILAAISFRSPKGNRFDAFASDIEYTEKVPDHAERNKRVVEYSKRLRAGAGSGYPLAAIVIPPTSLEINPNRWRDFPWTALTPYYEVFMPMNYWTARQKDPATAENLTKRNVEETRRMTGKPVHIIGGLGEYADEPQVASYVKAAREAGSLGGGLYDYTTTREEVWDELRALN